MEILKRLDHPNIVKAQNVPEGLNCSPMSNTPFICMEYCDGGDLRQVRVCVWRGGGVGREGGSVCVCVWMCVCWGGGGEELERGREGGRERGRKGGKVDRSKRGREGVRELKKRGGSNVVSVCVHH